MTDTSDAASTLDQVLERFLADSQTIEDFEAMLRDLSEIAATGSDHQGGEVTFKERMEVIKMLADRGWGKVGNKQRDTRGSERAIAALNSRLNSVVSAEPDELQDGGAEEESEERGA